MAAKNPLLILTEKVLAWYELIIQSIPNIIVAISVLFFFMFISKLARKYTYDLFIRITKNEVIANLLRSVLATAIFIIGFFITLEILHLEKTVASILAGAGVLGLALGFAFQEIASNFVSGVLIAFRKPYKIGDTIKIEGFFGKVVDINLRVTTITDDENLDVIIPNKDMFTKPFINYTNTPKRKISIEVGVSYSDDLELVEQVTKDALRDVKNIIDKNIEVYFDEFSESSINLSAKFWINYPNNSSYIASRHDAIKRIKLAYDENNITIPYPIRTLDINKEALLAFK